MKRHIILLLLAVAMLFVLAACDSSGGKLVVGVTQFEPMNFLDGSGNWTGFDTEFALAVGEKLGMEVEFQEIEWSRKFFELEAGNIDCIWNGFTANTDDGQTGRPRVEDADMSYSYMINRQCAVIRISRAGEFTSVADLAGKTAAVERGSAGDSLITGIIGSEMVIGSTAQRDTLIEVKSGAVDFSVIDIILAQQVTGTGDFTDLMIADIVFDAEEEVYAIGFSKGSELTARVNSAMQELFNEGKMEELAIKYKLDKSLKLSTSPIG